jgi:hypothetical protein
MRSPDWPTFLWSVIAVIVGLFIYHLIAGRKKES